LIGDIRSSGVASRQSEQASQPGDSGRQIPPADIETKSEIQEEDEDGDEEDQGVSEIYEIIQLQVCLITILY